MKIVNRNPKDLIPAEYNPRQLSIDEHQQISASLKRFGFVDPILVNKNKEREDIIIGGHQRTKVAIEMGLTEVPTVELNLTLDKERELNVRLNKNSGSWDFDILANEFDTGDLLEWGFSDFELDFFDDEVDDIDEVDDFSEEMTIKIICQDVQQFEDLQDKLQVNSKKITYEKLMEVL